MATERFSQLCLGFAPALTTLVRRPVKGIESIRRPPSPLSSVFMTPRCAMTASTNPIPSTSTETEPSSTDLKSNLSKGPLSFQDAILRLQEYWASKGCIVWHPYNVEVGAGTMNPATFLRVLGPEPWSVAYDEPSIRPDDSRYGENPNRLQRHTQFQVIVKPAPDCAQELVVGSYQALGIDTCKHDIRFVEDNWESPALGAWGLGWEVWLDGMEVTQFTYFQQAGGLTLDSVAVEVTYGLERIIMQLQEKTHFKDIIFSPGITYGEIFSQNEVEMSIYNMDEANIERNSSMFETYENEAKDLLQKRLPVPAYNYVLKASHAFNILDARGAIGVTERARYFQRMRTLARDVAKLWVERRKEVGYPLLNNKTNISSDELTFHSPNILSDISKSEADMVLEIGVEELPAADVSDVISQIHKLLSGLLAEARLSFSSIDVNGTPRRITAYIKNLQTKQDNETKRVRGPPLRVALKDGKPTKAATGFMKSQGITDEKNIEYDEKEGYMYGTVENIGLSTPEVIGKLIPTNLLAKINFSNTMRWNDSGISFSRPLRWLLCLIDDQVVPFEYAKLQSANYTRSLRGASGFAENVMISSADQYHQELADLQIVLSQEDRRARIRTEAVQLANKVGGTIPDTHLDGGLMDEVVDLVENPIPLIGTFDKDFLRLPDEVLITVMRKHQRYFPVISRSSGELINHFITVANGDKSLVDIPAIRAGNEAVLRARYADAAFFYDNDTKGKTLEDFLPRLSGLTFQESLGSMLDKVRRVQTSVPNYCQLMNLTPEETDVSSNIATLFRADLSTSMVVEMTSLAGTIGRHYAHKSGEVSKEVADGIFDANLPRFSGDKLADSRSSALVAIADRFDSLVGLFAVGLVPKSTSDPFALRRAALGAVLTLLKHEFDVDVRDLIDVTASSISEKGMSVEQDVKDAVVDFIGRRLEAHLLESMKVPDDIVKAALAVERNMTNFVSGVQICKELWQIRTNQADVLAKAQEAHGRAARLLKGSDMSVDKLMKQEISTELFESDEEKALWNALQSQDVTFKQADNNPSGKVHGMVEKLAGMKQEIDNYFDGVFVNADDPELKLNRLAVCARIVAIGRTVADLEMLQGS